MSTFWHARTVQLGALVAAFMAVVPAAVSAAAPVRVGGCVVPPALQPVGTYEELAYGRYDNSDVVKVYDLRARHLVSQAEAGATVAFGPPGPRTPSPPFPGVVTDMIVDPSGTLAWIALDANGPEPSWSVRVKALSGPPRLLAAGASIQPGSLALAGRSLYWTEAGAPRTAAL